MDLSTGRLATLVFLCLFVLLTSRAASAQTNDTGSVTLQGSVSGFVEVRAGGAASITLGGTITNNKNKGDRLNSPTTLTIDFGDVGPSNINSFVTALVPLRLRSNVSYTLKMSAAAITYGGGPPDASSVTLADIGFGVSSAARDSGGGVAAGTDTIAPTASGNPSLGLLGSVDAATGRYNYNTGFSLANYTTGTTIVSGPRIMNAMVPSGSTNGLVLQTVFTIKPQFSFHYTER
jgi:hypothetical protein